MLSDALSALASLLPTFEATGLIVAYVVVAGLLLSLNLHSAWSWRVKAIMNLVVVGFFWVTYTSWPGLLGWPTARELPRQFYLHAVNIDEPYRIYLWGTDLDHGLGTTTPRAFSLPYSTKLHDTVDKATRKLRKGLPVIGQVSKQAVDEEDLSLLEQTRTVDTDIVFIDAPDALVPGKN